MYIKPHIPFVAIFCVILAGCSVTPQVITKKEKEEFIKNDIKTLFANQEKVTKSITLYEAMARAIKYNLDHRLSLMEKMVSKQELDVSRYDMLPSVTAEAGYNWRSAYSGASSQEILSADQLTGVQSLQASTSQERVHNTKNVNVVWNVLDFGVSYVRAKQQANSVLIREEQRKKVVQNIIQDVREAFWRAASAQRMLLEMDELMHRANQALQRAKVLESLKLKKPLQALNYQKALLEIVHQMWSVRKNLSTAKTELAALMNLRPGQEFKIDLKDATSIDINQLDLDVEKLEEYALKYRPEVMESQYQARNSALEVKKSILRSMPGIELNINANNDDNKYLFRNTWGEVGAQVSWNLFNIFSAQSKINESKTREKLEEIRRLSLEMAVITQVNLAVHRFKLEKKNYNIIKDMADVEARIKANILAAKKAQTLNELEVIKGMAAELVARMQRELAYAELQNALARIYNSIGLDPLPARPETNDLSALAKELRSNMEYWDRGAGI